MPEFSTPKAADAMKRIKEEAEARLRRMKEPERIRADSGETIIIADFARINPVLDFHNGTALIMHPLAREKEIEQNGQTSVITVYENFVITSKKEIFKASESHFRKMDILAKLPESVLEPRWSANSILKWKKGEIDYNPYEVYSEIKGIFSNYMDMPEPSDYAANSLYSILTYIYPMFDSIPYLRFTGEKGSAKSKAAQIHEHLDFNTLNAVDMTTAALFRTVEETKGTMIIDEAESYGRRSDISENQEGRNQVVNSGWQKSGKVPRIEGNGGKRHKVNFSTYGPKIICGINTVTETLRDRSYEITLFKTLNKAKSKKTVRHESPMWQEIRDKLYVMVLNHYKRFKEIIDSNATENALDLYGREWDKAFPLLVIAKAIEGFMPEEEKESFREEVTGFLKSQHKKESEAAMDTLGYSVVLALEGAVGVKDTEITLSDLTDKVAEITEKSQQRNYNKTSYSKAVKSKIVNMDLGRSFRKGSGNKIVFTSNISLVKTARERYQMKITQNDDNSDNYGNYGNSDNFDNSRDEGKVIVSDNSGKSDNSQGPAIVGDKLSQLSKLSKKRTEGDHDFKTSAIDMETIRALKSMTENTPGMRYRNVNEIRGASTEQLSMDQIFESLERLNADRIVLKNKARYAMKEFVEVDMKGRRS